MNPLVIIIIIAIGLLLIASIFLPDVNKKKTVENFIKTINEKYSFLEVTPVQKQLYDLELFDNKTQNKYLIKFVTVPKNSDIQINNRTTYQVFYGGSNKPGQAKPYNNYLNEVINFINLETDNHKIIIFTPTPREINKYINENEMITVKSSTDVYGLTLLKENDYSYFKHLLEHHNSEE